MENKNLEKKVEVKHIQLNTIQLKASKSENSINEIVNTPKIVETPKCIILDKEINYII
jgi:endonuclease IV